MPEYCYLCKCGERFSKRLSVIACRKRMRCPRCGRRAQRDIVTEHRSVAHHPGNWPLKSTALGVNPEQIPEAKAEAAKHGVAIDFTPDGEAILTGPKHRKNYAELYGFHDKDGGYSDPQPAGPGGREA